MKHWFFRVIITQCTVDMVKLRELLCMIYRSRQCSFPILFFLLRFRVFFFLLFWGAVWQLKFSWWWNRTVPTTPRQCHAWWWPPLDPHPPAHIPRIEHPCYKYRSAPPEVLDPCKNPGKDISKNVLSIFITKREHNHTKAARGTSAGLGHTSTSQPARIVLLHLITQTHHIFSSRIFQFMLL